MAKVIISILSYNGEKHLPQCLESVRKIDYPKSEHEVIIVDNASVDSSVEFIKNNYPEYKLIESKINMGFAGGNNISWQKAKELQADYFVLLNQDTVVEPNFLSELVISIESDKKIAACQSLIMLWSKKELINSCGNKLHYLGFGYAGGYLRPRTEFPELFSNKTIDIGYASGGCVIYRMTALEKTGLFDEEFFAYHEDLDLSWKLRLAGYKIVLAPSSVIYHNYEFSRSIKKYYWMEKNRFIVFFTNYKLRTIFLILPIMLCMELGLFLSSIKSGFYIHKLQAYLFFLKPRSWLYLTKRRQFIDSMRATTDKHVLQYMTASILFQDIQNPILIYIANPFFELCFRLIKKIVCW